MVLTHPTQTAYQLLRTATVICLMSCAGPQPTTVPPGTNPSEPAAPVSDSEPIVLSGSSPALAPSTERLLERLPADTFLWIHFNNRSIRQSPFVEFFFGDDGFLLDLALSTHIPSFETASAGFVHDAEAIHTVFTHDRVGIQDVLTFIAGSFSSERVDDLLSERGTATEATPTQRYGPFESEAGSMIAYHHPEEGVTLGPEDRTGELLGLLAQPAGADFASAATVTESRLAFGGIGPSDSDVRIVMANTPAFSGYLREVFAAQNLTTEIIDQLAGIAANLAFEENGVRFTLGQTPSEPQFAAEAVTQIDALLEEWEALPLVRDSGMSAAVDARRQERSGGQTTFVVEADYETTTRFLLMFAQTWRSR